MSDDGFWAVAVSEQLDPHAAGDDGPMLGLNIRPSSGTPIVFGGLASPTFSAPPAPASASDPAARGPLSSPVPLHRAVSSPTGAGGIEAVFLRGPCRSPEPIPPAAEYFERMRKQSPGDSEKEPVRFPPNIPGRLDTQPRMLVETRFIFAPYREPAELAHPLNASGRPPAGRFGGLDDMSPTSSKMSSPAADIPGVGAMPPTLELSPTVDAEAGRGSPERDDAGSEPGSEPESDSESEPAASKAESDSEYSVGSEYMSESEYSDPGSRRRRTRPARKKRAYKEDLAAARARAPMLQRRKNSEDPCPCPKCGKVLATAFSCLRHFKTHTNVMPFKCPACPHVFKEKSTMTRHAKKHVEKLGAWVAVAANKLEMSKEDAARVKQAYDEAVRELYRDLPAGSSSGGASGSAGSGERRKKRARTS